MFVYVKAGNLLQVLECKYLHNKEKLENHTIQFRQFSLIYLCLQSF